MTDRTLKDCLPELFVPLVTLAAFMLLVFSLSLFIEGQMNEQKAECEKNGGVFLEFSRSSGCFKKELMLQLK